MVKLTFFTIDQFPPKQTRFVIRYTGNFRDGLWHGQGTQKFANGDVLTGVFTDDEFHGQGIRMFSDGRKYMPYFEDPLQLKKTTQTFCFKYIRLLGTWELS